MKQSMRPKSSAEADVMALLLDQYTPRTSYRSGEIVEGIVVRVHPRNLLVDIGGKSDALVHPREVEKMGPEALRALRPGQKVRVYVLNDGEDGDRLLVSLRRAAVQKDWERARALLEQKAPLKLEVFDCNRGGVLVRLGEVRGFVPASHLLPCRHVAQEPEDPARRWASLVGETLELEPIEVNPDRNRLIFSERKVYERAEKKREVLSKLEVGGVYAGVVRNLVEFGAFVNVNGVDGLVHISELSWRRVRHPSEIVEIGQPLRVYVMSIDLERLRLSLSLKKLRADPWKTIGERYHEGELVEVEIVNVVSFGAFACPVEMPEVEGLIHVSELSRERVEVPADVVAPGMRTTARILSVDPQRRRIAFSLKQTT
ncbi:MAG: 30S ribosomal protein S1 [Anaerolineae bacterium]